MNDTVEVWHTLGREDRVCEFGGKHRVSLCARKVLGPVVELREHNNGYEKRMTEVRKDWQGRTYHQHVTIDYHNNVYWVRDGDKKFFSRFPVNGVDITKDN